MSKEQTKDPESVGDVIEGLDEIADEVDEKICFGDVLDKFGSRSFAPVMMVLALLEISPIGAIPGVPTALAICIFAVAAQMLVGRDHIWVPDFVDKIGISPDKLHKGAEKMEGVGEKIDKIADNRLEFLTEGPAIQAAAAVIMLLCLFVAPLEVLPWASMGPMLAIAIISLALMARDGLAMLIAWLVAGAALGGAVYYFFSSGMTLSDFNPF